MKKYKINSIFSLIFLFFVGFSFAQEEKEGHIVEAVVYDYSDTSAYRLQVYETVNVPQNYNFLYRVNLPKMRRVYPLALRAKIIIDSLDMVLDDTPKKRKQKKVKRDTKKELKNEFKYMIRDMYVSEGQILMKLIYRETGMTVKEIIAKYINGVEASFYSTMGKMFDQDLNATFNPEIDPLDFVLECIINDFETGKVDFDPTAAGMTKAEYKAKKKAEKEAKKRRKKAKRQQKKQQKQ